MKKTSVFLTLLAVLFLIGCNKPTDKPVEKNSQESTPEENIDETIGYFQGQNKEEIWITLEKDETSKQTIFDISQIDDETIARIQKGDKVKIKHYSDFRFSDPMQGDAIDVEVLE